MSGTKKNKVESVPMAKNQSHIRSKLKPVAKQEKKQRKPGEWCQTLETKAQIARPADYTFQNMTELVSSAPELARTGRLGLLEKGPNYRLISRSLWLNNNKLKSLQNLHLLTESILEFPTLLGYLDLSCNELTFIHEDLFRFPNITILYLHGNRIGDPSDVHKLRKLTKLKHLTLYGNPMCERRDLGNIRKLVSSYLPQLSKLDHNRFTQLERDSPLATQALKILRAIEGEPEDWLFKKFPKPKLTPKLTAECHVDDESTDVDNPQDTADQDECNKKAREFMTSTLSPEK